MKSWNWIRQILVASFVLISCGTFGAAQTTRLAEGDGRLVEQHYRNSGGEKGLTTYLYDHNGLMYRARWELLDGSRHSNNYHTFDGDGNLTLKYREFSDGSISSVAYRFDDKGFLVAETFSRSDGAAGKTTYEYDEQGRLRQANCNLLNTWFTGTITYEHDGEGRRAGAKIFKDGGQIGTIAYDHDGSGNLVREHWDFGGIWSQTSTYVYEPVKPRQPPSYASTNVFVVNTADDRLVDESYDFNGEITGGADFEYDGDGKLVAKSYQTSHGLRTDTTLEYAKNGLLTRTERRYSNGLTAKFTYRFNGNRRLVHRAFERSDGVVGFERYDYDPRMRLTRAVYENFDSWLTGTIVFRHDENGAPKEGRFEGETFGSDITFDRDSRGNVTRIHWKFDFGKTQTYVLRYERVVPKPPAERTEGDR